MAEKLTPQQQTAVINRGGRLLVSAAAGSGKTKVLVDRLLSYLLDPHNPANLDEFLIITYTKAAASELRGKIASKLVEMIAKNPENRHLQQQMQRLYLTKIATVHSFCSDIIREFAYSLDIPGDFRVAEETECLQLQMRVLNRILDNAYENASENPDFSALIDSQGLGRDDRQIPDIILKVYNSSKCHLNPEEWLDNCIAAGCAEGICDAGETIWGQYLINDLKTTIALHLDAIRRCIEKSALAEGMEKPTALLNQIVTSLEQLQNCRTWDEIIQNSHIDYGRLIFPRKCSDTVLASQIKAVRNACKKGIDKKLRRFSDSSHQVLNDLRESAGAVRGLVALTREFGAEYDRLKRSYRILDFSDLEHKTLDLLLGAKRYGATAIARELSKRFREIMVDEYQDSNAVQDGIFSVLTEKRRNCFMVGDVKQSIYQFRLADPTIFLDKYNSFAPADEALPGQDRKVLLSSNFRSGGGVIQGVNDVFSACMSPRIGGLFYGEEEQLNEGIPHIGLGEAEVELYGVEVREDTYAEEASFVAERILRLLDGKHMVRQGDTLRPIQPQDIVILLRSPNSIGGDYYYALEQRGICCTTGGQADLLQTEEISVLYSLLQIISNPLQDIPLLAVLTSRIFGFTADELAEIRSENRKCNFYKALTSSDFAKAKEFISMLSNLRSEARLLSLCELLERIFAITRMDSIFSAMTDGENKTKNLQAFCQIASGFTTNGQRDLDRFLQYIDAIKDRGLPAPIGENSENAVTIMSIHKSKGLEYPVVFLCGLSREFNKESARAQVLCDKELGLGLSCVNHTQRVRYPSIAKNAISAKMMADSLSEEMRVLYVAMTRAKDRLIMTYASHRLENDLSELAMRMGVTDSELLAADADCPGMWVLQAAYSRTEAGAFFALGGYPSETKVSESPWHIQVVQADENGIARVHTQQEEITIDENVFTRIRDSLAFTYPHLQAIYAPSKLTATQLKGRFKDQEAAEFAKEQEMTLRSWRKPLNASSRKDSTAFGTTIHTVLQYIDYSACHCEESIKQEISRLVMQGYITSQQEAMVDSQKIAKFFQTELGAKLRRSKDVLREFKFSILDNGSRYIPDMVDEEILLQGVVDCALLESDGITIIDFKTDYVTEKTVPQLLQKYQHQVMVYADALSRIYQLPIKEKFLYSFCLDRFVSIK